MLRAFLIVWTVVAGLAATGLLYIVGWRPQTTVVAERLTAPSSAGLATAAPGAAPAAAQSGVSSGRAATAPVAGAPGNMASASPPASAPPTPATADVTSTGSIGATPVRAPTRIVRRVDEPTAPKPATEPRPAAVEGQPADTPIAAEPPKVVPQPRLATNARGPATAESRAGKAPPDQSPVKPDVEQSEPARSSAPVTAATPMSPPLFSEPENARASSRRQELAAVSPPSTPGPSRSTSEKITPDLSNRALKQRAKAAKTQTARTARAETTREAAVAERPVRPKAEAAGRGVRRQARMDQRSQRSRVAARAGGRSGSLDQLLQEFSGSGADYLHERTIRVGSRYLVERTTRHGTQYFYQQSMR
jgi:pilus assembly protein FimV